jgi:UDP-glucuronate 4-epimerase
MTNDPRALGVSQPRASTVIVTGAGGFIGFHTASALLGRGVQVVGVDNVNAYHSTKLKRDRLARLDAHSGFVFQELDISRAAAMRQLVAAERPACVIHLAAQAGVRWSIEHPFDYVDSNLTGFLSILEACRHAAVPNLIYASSSSVYGANTTLPFRASDNVDHPISLYAATKKANEAMAHAYSHLYGLPTTGLRFFTVYGPWGRPDMAMWKFADAICAGKPIQLYNFGKMQRDFTFVSDIVEAIVRLTDVPAAPNPEWTASHPDPATSSAPWRIFNIGNHSPVQVSYVVDLLEQHLGRKAERQYVDIQPGDVPATYADVEPLTEATGFAPATPIEEGVRLFAEWYSTYHEGPR